MDFQEPFVYYDNVFIYDQIFFIIWKEQNRMAFISVSSSFKIKAM